MGRRRRWLRACSGLLAGLPGLPSLVAGTGAAWAGGNGADPVAGAGPTRVVCLGGPVTEIAYALQAGDRIVGVDDSSTYPPQARTLPHVGYYRSFSVEGVVSLKPDLVAASDQAGPAASLAQLRMLGLPVLMLRSAPSLDALRTRIDTLADALGRRDRGRTLVARIDEEVATATAARHPARVLMLSDHTGRLLAAGTDTAADAILGLVGAVNVAAGQPGYRPISGESIAALNPDHILTTTLSVDAAGGLARFCARPGIAATAAARRGRVIVVDDLLLLGFGPRVGEALRAVAQGLA